MKIELSEHDIRNTLVFLGRVDLRGSTPDVLVAMAQLQTIFMEAQGKPANGATPVPAGDDRPNRAARRKKS